MNEQILELEAWIERFRGALQEIADADTTSHHVHHLTLIAQSALDGDLTTADLCNKESIDFKDRTREKKITMMQNVQADIYAQNTYKENEK